MSKEEAVKLLENVLAQLRCTIAEHNQIQAALEVLKNSSIIKVEEK